MRRNLWSSGALFAALLILAATAALAEVSVVIGYDTRAVGEIDPCG